MIDAQAENHGESRNEHMDRPRGGVPVSPFQVWWEQQAWHSIRGPVDDWKQLKDLARAAWQAAADLGSAKDDQTVEERLSRLERRPRCMGGPPQ